jgi:hypothetical protein
MVELSYDRGFARKSRGVSGSTFKFRMRYLERDGLTHLAVNSLEHGGHPAMFDKLLDLETLIQNLANFDFAAQMQSNAT